MDRGTEVIFEELPPERYREVLPLFAGHDYSLSLRAAAEGTNPGRVFVDDAERPRTGLALTVEGYLLAGDHSSPQTVAALRRLLEEKLFTGQVYVNGDESLSLAVHPPSWEAILPELIPTHEPEVLARYHYLCRRLAYDWRAHLPAGYRVRRIDRELIGDRSVVLAEGMGGWEEIEECWGSLDRFLERGVGFCVLQGNEVVARCGADCATAEQVDVGIETHPAHRRRGLAAAAVAATVEHCLAHGWRRVGWHCNAENTGSWKTAEKVGFERNREYAYYYYMYDLIDHWAELGWMHYRRGDPAPAAEYYERVFAARAENPDYYYHVAALANAQLGNTDSALRYLNLAVDRGWRHVGWTRKQAAFEPLHGLPGWEEVLARMEAAAEPPDS